MKTSLPFLTLCWLAISYQAAVAQRVASESPVPDPGQPASARQPVESDVSSGDRLVKRAAAALAAQPTIRASLRQKSNLMGHRVLGKGMYLQKQSGSERLTRLELTVQVADQVTSQLEVSDGRFLWIDRQTAERRRVSRVDTQQVRRAWRAEGPPDGVPPRSVPPRSVPPHEALAISGLPSLIEQLLANFQFTAPQLTQLGDFPAYALVGTWRAERIQQLIGQIEGPEGRRERHADIPPHIPTEVALVLGQEDLFPYVIEYRRPASSREGQGGEAVDGSVLMRLEWFEVAFGVPIDSQLFQYEPGDRSVADHTQQFIQRKR